MRLGIFPVMAGREAGGPETYECSLVRALPKLHPENEYHIFCLNQKAIDAFHLSHDSVRFHLLRPGWRWISIPCSLPMKLSKIGVDLLHATFVPPPYSPVDYVFTMHDISMFIYPEFYPRSIRWRLNRLIHRGVKKARLVLCISEHSRQMAVERFNLPVDRTAVVYHGVDERFIPVSEAIAKEKLSLMYGIDPPYLLFIGKFEQRKNLFRLVKAFYRFREESKADVKLVLVGKRVWGEESLDDLLDQFRLREHVLEPGYIADEDLPALYSRAEMLVFPSLWEGFGLPLLEAMACGTPVVTSNVSCLPEIAGEAAVFVDPLSPESIADGIYRVYNDYQLRDSLRKKGFLRASQFTWENTARQTFEVYQRVLNAKQ